MSPETRSALTQAKVGVMMFLFDRGNGLCYIQCDHCVSDKSRINSKFSTFGQMFKISVLLLLLPMQFIYKKHIIKIEYVLNKNCVSTIAFYYLHFNLHIQTTQTLLKQ